MALAIVTDIGKINIPEDIIGTIAGYAAMENYGIIGMCARTAGDAFLELLGGDNVQKGVKIDKVNTAIRSSSITIVGSSLSPTAIV